MERRRRRQHAGAVAIVLLLSLPAALAQEPSIPLQPLADWLQAHPMLAPLLFVLSYAVGITLFLPGQLFCLLGGALFGPWLGGVLNMVGATLGAVMIFLLARYRGISLVERHLGTMARKIREGVERQGWRFVAFVRLIPAVPYNLSCYAFGLCRISLLQYAVTNALCLLPRLVAYAYIGHSGMNLLSGEGDQLIQLVTIGSLLIALLLLPLLYHRMRHSLKP